MISSLHRLPLARCTAPHGVGPHAEPPRIEAHLAIHRRGGAEMLLRLLALGRAAVELAETISLSPTSPNVLPLKHYFGKSPKR